MADMSTICIKYSVSSGFQAYRLIGTKPLLEPMPTYCQFEHQENNLGEIWIRLHMKLNKIRIINLEVLLQNISFCAHVKIPLSPISWWRHQMDTFSALLALCAGNSPVTGEFTTQRPVTRSFDVLFDLRPNKRWSKQSWGWWFETPSRSLWRHCNVLQVQSDDPPKWPWVPGWCKQGGSLCQAQDIRSPGRMQGRARAG